MRIALLTTLFFTFTSLPAFAEKISFRSADLHLSVPLNFEKVSDGIAAETLIRLRVKGKPPTPQCSIAFAKDPELSNLSIREIESVIDQITAETFVSMMSESTPIFRLQGS